MQRNERTARSTQAGARWAACMKLSLKQCAIVRKLAAVAGGVEKRGLNFELAGFFEHTRNFGFNIFQAGR